MAKEYEYHVFQPITTAQYQESFYKAIGQNWALITSRKDDRINAMTASWGGIGVIWDKDVVFAFVRKSRFTRECLDATGAFSLSFLDHSTYAREYKFMGSVSGRDEDKIAGARLHAATQLGIPFIDEAATVILCNTMFRQELKPDGFTVQGLDKKFYPDGDNHILYVGEVVKIMCR